MKLVYPYIYLNYEVKFYNEIRALLDKVTNLIDKWRGASIL